MIDDKEVKKYLNLRKKLKSPDHHMLSPIQLRKERLRQLELDDLRGPELESVFDVHLQKELKIRFYIPTKLKNKVKVPFILYFHGGGFVMGNLDTHDYPCRCIASFSQMIVIAVDYRLAPEYKFPAAVNDAKNVLYLINKINLEYLDFDNLIVCGDSAGGNLATILSIKSSQENFYKIKGQILIYPWVDLTISTRSSDFDLPGATLTGKTIKYFAEHYLKNQIDEMNVEASPIFYPSLSNQPVTYIFAAELDPLLDEGIIYKNRLLSFNNTVYYKLYKDQLHGFVTNSRHFPKGLECLRDIAVAAKKIVSL